jgi:hypothetical protein
VLNDGLNTSITQLVGGGSYWIWRAKYIYIYFCGYLRTINHAVQVIKCYIDDFMIQIWSKMKGKAYKMTDAESIV